jgi:hypothetical protein
MRKQIKWVAVVLFAAVVGTGVAALLATPPASAGSCYKVDCNICCPIGGGKVVCTQRACV